MKYEFMILFILLTLPILSHEIYAENVPDLTKTKDGISIISYIPSFDPKNIELKLINLGNGTANITNTIQTDLVLKQEVSFSQLPPSIDKSRIISSTMPISIGPFGDSKDVKWIMNENKLDEGTYTGFLVINGSNFKPITTPVSISYVVSPWFMILMTMIGIGIALFLGFWYSLNEAKQKTYDEHLSSIDTILYLNKIIFELNIIRKNVDTNRWNDIFIIAKNHITEIESKIEKLQLNKDLEDVKWFEKIHDGLMESCCDGEISDNNKLIPLFNAKELLELLQKTYPQESISSFSFQDSKEYFVSQDFHKQMVDTNFLVLLNRLEKSEKDNKLQFAQHFSSLTDDDINKKIKELRKQISKKSRNKNKWAYFAGTSIFTSLASIFVLDNIVGPLWLNIILGVITGFSVYRTQDFAKLFKKED